MHPIRMYVRVPQALSIQTAIPACYVAARMASSANVLYFSLHLSVMISKLRTGTLT